MEAYRKQGKVGAEEQRFLSKISKVVKWAKDNKRDDILKSVEEAGTITNKTNLKSLYYNIYKLQQGNQRPEIKSEMSKQLNQNTEGDGAASNTPPNPPTPPSQTDSSNPSPAETVDAEPFFSAPTKDRAYATGFKSGDDEFIPPPENAGGQFTPPPQAEEEQEPEESQRFNDMEDLPKGLKNASAKDLAEIITGLYCEKIPEAFRAISAYPIRPNRLLELHANGEINLMMTVHIPVPRPRTSTVAEEFNSIRDKIQGKFITPPEKQQAIQEALEVVLKQKSIGITPEQKLMFLVGEDLLNKSMEAWGTRNDIRQTLEFIKAAAKASRRPPPPPDAREDYAAPPPPPPPSPPAPESKQRFDIKRNEPETVEAEEVDDNGEPI